MHLFAPLGRLEEKYARELVVIGVHSGKFHAEREAPLILEAMRRYELRHPVVNDREFAVWQAYAARAWPTLYFIDPQGYVIGKHEGEADFGALDRFVAALVSEYESEGLLDRRPLPFQVEAGGATGDLAFPGGLDADVDGTLVIADSNHHRILLAAVEGGRARIRKVFGDGRPGLRDGAPEEARFCRPQGVALDGYRVWVADTGNHAVRRIDLPSGRVSTEAGTGDLGWGTPDGATVKATETALRSPWDVLVMDDHVLIAMAGAHQIWTLDRVPGTLSVLAGAGPEMLHDGRFERAAFNQPSGLARLEGALYVADTEASAVRRLDLAARRVRTVVGVGLFDFGDEDGTGDRVRLQHPVGVAADPARGCLYVADTYNHKIKRLDPESRRAETLAGDGRRGFLDGDFAAARFDQPGGLALAGDLLFVADTGNHAVRVLDLGRASVTTLDLSFV